MIMMMHIEMNVRTVTQHYYPIKAIVLKICKVSSDIFVRQKLLEEQVSCGLQQ